MFGCENKLDEKEGRKNDSSLKRLHYLLYSLFVSKKFKHFHQIFYLKGYVCVCVREKERERKRERERETNKYTVILF